MAKTINQAPTPLREEFYRRRYVRYPTPKGQDEPVIYRDIMNYADSAVERYPPPRYSLGHPFGDNPLRGANEEEGRNPAGRGSGGRP